jgi:hypothetical protein
MGCVSAKQLPGDRDGALEAGRESDVEDMLPSGYAVAASGYAEQITDAAAKEQSTAAAAAAAVDQSTDAAAAEQSNETAATEQSNDAAAAEQTNTVKVLTMDGKDLEIAVSKADILKAVKIKIMEAKGISLALQDLYTEGSEEPLADDTLVSSLSSDLYLVVKDLPYDGDMAAAMKAQDREAIRKLMEHRNQGSSIW